MNNSSINGSDVSLSNLNNCQISIIDHIGALRINNINNAPMKSICCLKKNFI